MDNIQVVKDLITKKNNEYIGYKEHYNCMGWALDVKRWLRPLMYHAEFDDYPREVMVDDLIFELDTDDEVIISEKLLSMETDALIKDFGLSLATTAEISNPLIDLIAFREQVDFTLGNDGLRCWDTDFHFRKRVNGIWTEKCGGTKIRICNTQDMEEDLWNDTYCGRVVYFVKR